MTIFLSVLLTVIVTACPQASPDVLEPSVQNEVEHALSVASTNAIPDTAAARDFVRRH